jgi:hypothetical protein
LAVAGRKLESRGTVAAVDPGNSTAKPGRLFFILDSVSGKKLRVDTGSSYSIFPFRAECRSCSPRLRAANGQLICCWGTRQWRLEMGGKLYQFPHPGCGLFETPQAPRRCGRQPADPSECSQYRRWRRRSFRCLPPPPAAGDEAEATGRRTRRRWIYSGPFGGDEWR